ncbi:MAG TPA: CRTAC1 family protein [Terriglobia bacterium]|nr:CRTAC1 family protein [Terriglobia bacterium]
MALVKYFLFSLLTAVLPATVVTFREVPPQESGVTWVHDNARSPQRYLPETEPPGVAIFDYNNDGLMDLLFVNSGEAPFFHPAKPRPYALYRNNGDGTFTDVTEKAGINPHLFGMGVAVGDYDGDGYQDVFITGYGRSVLYHNNRDGTFTDVTAQSGINAPGWSTSAVWFDYNNDGKLDLFVCQFVEYSDLRICGVENSYGGKMEGASKDEAFYCYPKILPPTASHLYRNDGNGHFTDVSVETGISGSMGKGLGVVATDINNDGYMDLLVTNDTVANFLFVNRGGKKFEEIGQAAGVAFSEDGVTRSGMGVDSADYDQDGRQDLFVANLDQELFALYRNLGDELFDDMSMRTGIAGATRLMSGWGLRFLDYDNDGLMDLILSGGHPDDHIDERMRGVTFAEPLLLFHNDGKGKFTNVSKVSGAMFEKSYAARGLAVGDLNNDGYPDVVVGISGGAPLILYNNAESRNHWIGLHLTGTTSNPDAVGALLKWSVGGAVHSLFKRGGGSFMSSHDPREILGMGKETHVDWVEIHWPKPSERVDRFTNLPLDKYSTIVEGKGIQ